MFKASVAGLWLIENVDKWVKNFKRIINYYKKLYMKQLTIEDLKQEAKNFSLLVIPLLE